MRRAIVIVLDGCGAGAAPDAADFGDSLEPSTLLHVWQAVGGLKAPNLASLGFLQAGGIDVEAPDLAGKRAFARLQPMSKGGKDSVTGHWEMMGIVESQPFPTYPNGFPESLIGPFAERFATQVLGNRAASGTQIIDELGEEHVATGFPIVYTSADSVFQIACHEAIVPIEKLYEMCRFARELCVKPNNVQRVIARPFEGDGQHGFRRTGRRKDFPAPPPENVIDRLGDVAGVGVVPELFGGRGFRTGRRTQNNAEHEQAVFEALEGDARFIFANFEDTDMLFGHRNDPEGFGKCLERFDAFLGDLLARLHAEDMLILTADHGNDPTDVSTDHTREYVPFTVYLPGSGFSNLNNFGALSGFGSVGATVEEYLTGGSPSDLSVLRKL